MKKISFIFIILSLTPAICAQTWEQKVIAGVLLGEAGGEKELKAMPAVYEVIKNRAKNRQLTPYQVVRERYQFSFVTGKSDGEIISRGLRHGKWQIAITIVMKDRDTNYTQGADHYFAWKLIRPPYWADLSKKTVRVGGHDFYKLN